MEVTNAQLLQSQQALQNLSQASLKGVHALHLMDILDAVRDRLDRLQEVQQNLMERDDLSDEAAQEEWQEILRDTTEIDEEPLPQKAVETIQISAGALMTLGWLLK